MPQDSSLCCINTVANCINLLYVLNSYLQIVEGNKRKFTAGHRAVPSGAGKGSAVLPFFENLCPV